MFHFEKNNEECLIILKEHHISALKFLKTTSNMYDSF
jgi:hypothetical protein